MAEPEVVLCNGQWQSAVAANDRGLAYGDGLFETLPVTAAGSPLWLHHRRRLQTGCQRLAITVDWDALDREFAALCDEGLRRLQQPAAVARLTITRTSAGRGYSPHRSSDSNRYWSLHPASAEPVRQDWRLIICETPLAIQPALAGLKHLCRLEQVLARSEWTDPAIDEGIMLDTAGFVREGTMTNLFFIHQGALHTPTLNGCGVRGIIRERLIEELAPALGYPVIEGDYRLPQLRQAEAVFLCNSVVGIREVAAIDTTEFSPGHPWIDSLRRQLRQYGYGPS